MLEIVGVLLAISALIITAWWVTGEHSHKGWAFTICLFAVFVGAFLILHERVTEFTVKGVGTIKSAAEKAIADADTISNLKERVEAQSATVDLVAKEASKAKKISEEVAEKNRIAGEKLATLDEAIDQIKKLALALSNPTASSLAIRGMLQYLHLKYKIEKIENIRGSLQELDISEKEIDQALNVFTSRVFADHMKRILIHLNKKLPEEKKLFTEIKDINAHDWDLERVNKAISENEIELEGELKEAIFDLEFYKDNKKLRRESKWQG